ncbi:NAD-P-binding protein [Fomes fomentarius]|nr:NAD-P-binding protein [Fomes fomentarius]
MSNSNPGRTSIFLTGATGYIGGAILARLLKHRNAKNLDITALVRNADKAKILESKFSVKVIVGSHQEVDKVQALAEQSHVVFNLADADDVPFTEALLEGLKKRHEKRGDLPILIHTSGTGLLTDDARGEYSTDTIYDDCNVEQIKSIPETAEHRQVDLRIVDADQKGYIRSHIILPSTIYGTANHELVVGGVSNPHSIQVPLLIRAALDRKRAGVVGKGRALWPDVHIDDIADLYITLFDSINNNPEKTGHGWEGFYFGENGEHTWYQLSKAIGEALVALGITQDSEPTTFSVEELVKYFGAEEWGWHGGTNSRCRANRARAIGWKPKYATEDFLKSIRPEVEALWNKSQ